MNRRPCSLKTSILILSVLCSGCATSSLNNRDRLVLGLGLGSAAGASGGAILSPNDESRGLNALVFGLAGALAGGLIALWQSPHTSERPAPKLKERELQSSGTSNDRREYVVPSEPRLPDFLRTRLRPAVVEEYTERDTITEDGALSAPHKVYRIKRPAELIANPIEEKAP